MGNRDDLVHLVVLVEVLVRISGNTSSFEHGFCRSILVGLLTLTVASLRSLAGLNIHLTFMQLRYDFYTCHCGSSYSTKAFVT